MRVGELAPDELRKLNALSQSPHVLETIGQMIDFTYNVDFYAHMDVRTFSELGDYYLNKSGMVQMPQEWKAGIDPAAFGNNAAQKEQGEFTEYGYIVASGDQWEPRFEGSHIPHYELPAAPHWPKTEIINSVGGRFAELQKAQGKEQTTGQEKPARGGKADMPQQSKQEAPGQKEQTQPENPLVASERSTEQNYNMSFSHYLLKPGTSHLSNLRERKTLQSAKIATSFNAYLVVPDAHSSSDSISLTSFAVAMTIRRPLSLISSSRLSSCLRCVDLSVPLSGKKNMSTEIFKRVTSS